MEEKKTVNEKIKESVDRVKTHLVENKETYIAVGISFVAGAIANAVFNQIANKPVINIEANPTFNNSNVNTNTNTNYLGYATKIVKCVETGEIFEKVKDAASSAGVPADVMSRHINGHTDHISSLHYVIIGQGVTE